MRPPDRSVAVWKQARAKSDSGICPTVEPGLSWKHKQAVAASMYDVDDNLMVN